MALCRLECPICQQNLLKHAATDEAGSDGTSPLEQRHRDRDRQHSWSWSPISTPCGHLFHNGCILEWFRRRRHHEGSSRLRGSCPTCRKSIAYYNLVRVYLTPASGDPMSEEDSTTVNPPAGPSPSSSSNVHDYDEIDSLLPESEQQGSHNQLTSNTSRMYNEIFNMSVRRRSHHRDLMRLHMRMRSRRDRDWGMDNEEDLRFPEMLCRNPDCTDLRHAFYILTRECKALQRRLTMELDVSKMKSILVASQQRDINHLRMRKADRTKTWLFTLGFGTVISVWLIVSVVLIFSAVGFFQGIGGESDSSCYVEEL